MGQTEGGIFENLPLVCEVTVQPSADRRVNHACTNEHDWLSMAKLLQTDRKTGNCGSAITCLYDTIDEVMLNYEGAIISSHLSLTLSEIL